MNLIKTLFDSSVFMPHGHCYLWNPAMVWLHVISDGAIVLAYYAIPAFLLAFAAKKKDFPYGWMFVLFAVFIVSCGTTHLFEIWSVWVPTYWLSGLVKAWTGIISLLTAVLLIPVMPKALALRGPKELEIANKKLQNEILEHRRTEEELKKSAKMLSLKKEQLSRSKTDLEQLELFSYVATHDLREPLYKIISFGDLLKLHSGSMLDEKSRHDLERIQNAARRLDQMIEELRDFAKIGKSETPFEKVDLAEVIKETLSDLELRIKEANATVEVGKLPEIEGDRVQMRQLFQNLLGNALKFRKQETPCRISVQSRADGDFVEISIHDEGIGFDEIYIDRIFKPFQRLHGVDEYAGSGLGLAICQKIAARHHGQITAKSIPGQGATFLIRLPLRQTE